MKSNKSNTPSDKRMPVFAMSCWVLALMAFFQLLIAGMALATRFEESQVVKMVVKEVPKFVAVRVPAAIPSADKAPAMVPRPSVQMPAAVPALPPPTPVATPKIADPRTERLVNEARQARVASDMGMAIMKLEEALNQSPDDPNVHFELGLVHEQMGVFDIASAHFERVFQMGASGAGSLYDRAAAKLRDGFDQPDTHGKLSLGRVQIFKDPNFEDGQRVVLTIPTQKAPGEDLDLNDISVEVRFFNRTSKGEIIQLEDESWVTQKRWLNLPFDFSDGEENLRITYVIPNQDLQTRHIFGEPTYYGQVVSLLYKGEILDVAPWPRDLAIRIPAAPSTNPTPEFQENLPGDFDLNSGVLPPLPPP